MKEVIRTEYRCEICGKTYDKKEEAESCESMPISEDKEVKIGDKVRILTGAGAGETATVTVISVMDKYWGHYAWERYWHTVGIVADLDSNYGSRWLTFDAYEVIK